MSATSTKTLGPASACLQSSFSPSPARLPDCSSPPWHQSSVPRFYGPSRARGRLCRGSCGCAPPRRPWPVCTPRRARCCCRRRRSASRAPSTTRPSCGRRSPHTAATTGRLSGACKAAHPPPPPPGGAEARREQRRRGGTRRRPAQLTRGARAIRLVSAGLVPLALAPIVAGTLNPLLDATLCSLLVVHSHMGFQCVPATLCPVSLPRAAAAKLTAPRRGAATGRASPTTCPRTACRGCTRRPCGPCAPALPPSPTPCSSSRRLTSASPRPSSASGAHEPGARRRGRGAQEGERSRRRRRRDVLHQAEGWVSLQACMSMCGWRTASCACYALMNFVQCFVFVVGCLAHRDARSRSNARLRADHPSADVFSLPVKSLTSLLLCAGPATRYTTLHGVRRLADGH